jgi:hypothetical protein
MLGFVGAAALVFGAMPVPAFASGWELEIGGGLGTGTRFTVRSPFTWRGVTYAGPYNGCALPAEVLATDPLASEFCLFFGLGDIAYTRFDEYPWSVLGAVEIRRRVRGPWSLGAGLLSGPARRRQHVYRRVLSEVVATRVPEPEELYFWWQVNSNLRGRTGVGWLGYLHGSLRYDHVFGPERSMYGGFRNRAGVFVEAGAGSLPTFYGAGEAGAGGPKPAVHMSVGVRRHARGPDFTFTVTHLRALTGKGSLKGGSFAWTLARIGWAFD